MCIRDRCRHRQTPRAHANWFPTAGWKPNPRHRRQTPSDPRWSTWGPALATSLPDTALESCRHFRLAHASSESLPVRCGEIGKVSQVGDDLLARTVAGANVLDQLPITVGPAALLDDRAAEKHGCHPSWRPIAQANNDRSTRIDQWVRYDLSLHAFSWILGT